MKLYY